jgi:hypothetical protein
MLRRQSGMRGVGCRSVPVPESSTSEVDPMKFTLDKLRYVIFITTSLGVVLSIVAYFIPDEKAPNVVVLDQNTTQFLLQSREEAILWSLGAFLFLVLTILYLRFEFRRKQIEVVPQGCAGWAIMLVFLLVFGTLFLFGIVVNPYRDFRSVTISPQEVTFTCLYRSWTVRRLDIQTVQLFCEERGHHGSRSVQFNLKVTTKDERSYRSVFIGCQKTDKQELRELETVFDGLEKELKRKP